MTDEDRQYWCRCYTRGAMHTIGVHARNITRQLNNIETPLKRGRSEPYTIEARLAEMEQYIANTRRYLRGELTEYEERIEFARPMGEQP